MDKKQRRQVLNRMVGAILDLDDDKLMGACVITFDGDRGALVSIHGDLEAHGLKEALEILTKKLGLMGEAECQDLPIQN